MEEPPPPKGIPLYSINEDDLTTLMDDLRKILTATMMSCNDKTVRMRWRRVIQIMTNVWWDYGPPSEVSRHESKEDCD